MHSAHRPSDERHRYGTGSISNTPKTNELINFGFIYAIHKAKENAMPTANEKKNRSVAHAFAKSEKRRGKTLLNIIELAEISSNTFRNYFRSIAAAAAAEAVGRPHT